MSITTSGRALQPTLPVWGLLGRTLLVALGTILVVPAPWTATYYYKFLVDHVALPDGKRLRFTGQAGDIWYVFVAIAALAWIQGLAQHSERFQHLGLLWALMLAALTVRIFIWFCANLKSEDDRLSVSFEGGYWPYIGWYLLLMVSFITIIGWAWVIKYMMQWICRNVRGTVGFDFQATGLQILWRTLVAGLLGILIIPFPWVHRWYVNWFISQVAVVPSGDAPVTT
jgi:hypothetical protein